MDSDEDLLARSVREPVLFEPLVTAHAAALHGYLRRRAPKVADDLLAEVWLAAFAGRGRFDPVKGSVRGWLFGVARHVLLTELRRSRARPVPRADPVEDAWEAVDSRLDAAAVAPRMRAALALLPAVERELLLLVAWEQLTPTEAAQVVGVPAGTARSRLYRARTQMREHLDVDPHSSSATPTQGAPS